MIVPPERLILKSKLGLRFWLWCVFESVNVKGWTRSSFSSSKATYSFSIKYLKIYYWVYLVVNTNGVYISIHLFFLKTVKYFIIILLLINYDLDFGLPMDEQDLLFLLLLQKQLPFIIEFSDIYRLCLLENAIVLRVPDPYFENYCQFHLPKNC